MDMEKKDFRILVVDDTPENIAVLDGILRPFYKIQVSRSGERALRLAGTDPKPDLILLDVMMPEMNGYEVITELKKEPMTADIPVIFITAKTETQDEALGLGMGAVDYITKPVNKAIVLARVKTHLELKKSREELKNQNSILNHMVDERTREIELTRDIVFTSLASLSETRDNETGGHIFRTSRYMKVLASELAKTAPEKGNLDENVIRMLYKSAPLHDIGKVGITDRILLKPGKLTDEEFEVMKTHTVLGKQALLNVEKRLGTTAFLSYAKEIAASHHERWDGLGYPEGLSGDDIPLSGRLMAIADVYDALISKRIYKPPFSHKKALGIIQEGKGFQFDPVIFQCFMSISEEFKGIAIEYADSEEELKALMSDE